MHIPENLDKVSADSGFVDAARRLSSPFPENINHPDSNLADPHNANSGNSLRLDGLDLEKRMNSEMNPKENIPNSPELQKKAKPKRPNISITTLKLSSIRKEISGVNSGTEPARKEIFSPGFLSPTQRKTIVAEYDEAIPNIQKLEILKRKAPVFESKMKLFPLFSAKGLGQHSLAFHYYFKLYHIFFQLIGILLIFTILQYLIANFVIDQEALFWFDFGYAFFCMIVIRLILRYNQKELLNDNEVGHEEWTQNKFSVLVENLGSMTDKVEIRKFFEEKMNECGYDGKLLEILLLQNCIEFKDLSKKLRKIEYLKKRDSQNPLIGEGEKLQMQHENYLTSVENYSYYQGKAILIFDTMKGRQIVKKYFKIGFLRKILYSLCFCCLGRKYRLCGNIPKISTISEPADVVFEHLHISAGTRLCREILSTIFQSIVFTGIIIIVVLVKTNNYTGDTAPEFPVYYYSAAGVAINMSLYAFGDFLIAKVLIRRSRSSKELERIRMRLNLTFLNVNVFLSVLWYVSQAEFSHQIWFTGLILLVVAPLKKILGLLDLKKIRIRRRLIRDPDLIIRYTQSEIVDIFTNPVYDFAENLEQLICFVFIALGFYFIGSFWIVSLMIVGLLISLVIDKTILFQFSSPWRLQSSDLGLQLFDVLHWDLRLQALTFAFINASLLGSDRMPYALQIVIFVMLSLIALVPLSTGLKRKWKERWSKERENVKYTDVEHIFVHKYQDEYPLDVY